MEDNTPAGFDQENMAWDMRRQVYIFEDPASGAVFFWDSTKDQWVLDTSVDPSEGAEEPGEPYNPDSDSYDPEHGSEQVEEKRTLEGIEENNANNEKNPQLKKEELQAAPANPDLQKEENKDTEKKKKRKRKAKKKKTPSTLYVTGLPKDVTEEEFIDFFKTAGIIAKDPITLLPKIKIYRDDDGVPKGDGLVSFLKAPSIPNAFQLLDGFDFRPPQNHIVKLELAKFENKPGKEKPRYTVSLSKKQKRYNQELAELSWEDKEQKHVIIKHMFDASVAAQDLYFYDKLREEIEAEFNRIGPIEALKIFERNLEGVVAVKYTHELDAQKCIERMNGRWFDGRQLSASYYDGFTNYFVPESEDQNMQRDNEWAKWLVGNDEYEKTQKENLEQVDEKT